MTTTQYVNTHDVNSHASSRLRERWWPCRPS